MIESITASTEIMEKLTIDEVFREFVSIITEGLEEFISKFDIKIDYEFYFRKDWEIQNQENLILFIDFLEIPDFKEKIEKSNEITLFIEEKIIKLIHKTSQGKKEKLEELRYTFFTSIMPIRVVKNGAFI